MEPHCAGITGVKRHVDDSIHQCLPKKSLRPFFRRSNDIVPPAYTNSDIMTLARTASGSSLSVGYVAQHSYINNH